MEGNGFMAKARKGDKGEQYKSALATRLRNQIDKGPKTKLVDIADATGISRQTISQLISIRAYYPSAAPRNKPVSEVYLPMM